MDLSRSFVGTPRRVGGDIGLLLDLSWTTFTPGCGTWNPRGWSLLWPRCNPHLVFQDASYHALPLVASPPRHYQRQQQQQMGSAHNNGYQQNQRRSLPPPLSSVATQSHSQQNNSQTGTMSFKTRNCEQFARWGFCEMGLRCRFAHGAEELRPPVSTLYFSPLRLSLSLPLSLSFFVDHVSTQSE